MSATLRLTADHAHIVVSALEALAHGLASGAVRQCETHRITTPELQSVIRAAKNAQLQSATPIADAVADMAHGNRYDEQALRDAQRLVAQVFDRTAAAGNALLEAMKGTPRQGHELGDAAVLLAAVEHLYIPPGAIHGPA